MATEPTEEVVITHRRETGPQCCCADVHANVEKDGTIGLWFCGFHVGSTHPGPCPNHPAPRGSKLKR